MTGLRKCWIWSYMFSKRLLHKFSFIVLLCMIPVLIPLANSAMSSKSGVLKIVLCSEDDTALSKEIMHTLLEDDGIIHFLQCESPDAAKETVAKHEADAAWIFSGNLDEKIDKYVAKERMRPFVEVVERSDTVPLQLSREILYGAVYDSLSYSLYKNFVYTTLVSEDTAPEHELRAVYDKTKDLGNVVEITRLNSDAPVATANYLTVPLRGLLSLMIMLCTMAAAMYFLKDNAEGKYDWMSTKKRLAPAFASCFCAAIFSAIAVWIALLVSGISTGAVRELVSLFLFVLSATGFCLLLCILFRSPGKLGASIPGLIIIMLALSPIFFNLKVLRPVRLLLPTHYYLYTTYNSDYYLYTVFYCMAIYAAVFLLNALLSNARKRQSFS